MEELRWRHREWRVGGRRHLVLWLNLPVAPYTRQTRGTRWRDDRRGEAVQAYNASLGALRDAVRACMVQEGVAAFPARPLGLAATFWGAPPRRVGQIDLGNLEKAAEDALQGALIPNDRWVWERCDPGPCRHGAKLVGQEDAVEVHVWEVA